MHILYSLRFILICQQAQGNHELNKVNFFTQRPLDLCFYTRNVFTISHYSDITFHHMLILVSKDIVESNLKCVTQLVILLSGKKIVYAVVFNHTRYKRLFCHFYFEFQIIQY